MIRFKIKYYFNELGFVYFNSWEKVKRFDLCFLQKERRDKGIRW